MFKDPHDGVISHERKYQTTDLTTAYLADVDSMSSLPLYGLTAENLQDIYFRAERGEIEHDRHWMVDKAINTVSSW